MFFEDLLRAAWRRWAVPVVSAGLIVAALAARQLDPAAGHLLMVVAAVVAGARIATRALAALRTGTVGIELLVTVAAAGAVVIGEYWEAAAVTFLFALGGALEATTIGHTRQAVAALLDLAPTTAVVVRDGRPREVPAAQVAIGETVVVKHGARVPVDGVITDGQATVDESSITGESIPVEKSTGDRVFAGTTNLGGYATVRTTGAGADTTLARIIHRVEQAQEQKARAQRFMERFARWYTPGIIALAGLAGVLTGDVVLALTLLVIGCPGALVISMPVSIIAGIGRAARRGILIKGGEHLETIAKVDAVALDKTGTLTTGRPRLTDLRPASGVTRTELLTWAAAAEAGSEHPLAVPVLAAAGDAKLAPAGPPEGVRSHPGKGIEAVVRGERVLVGTPALLAEFGVAVSPAERAAVTALAQAGRTPMLVSRGDRVLGALAVADQVRPDAADLVAGLRAAGVDRVVMLTGDHPAVAQAVARQAGIGEVHAGLLPGDKVTVVERLRREGHRVAMVGDGVNDAPALATADAGVAMGVAGSHVAIETADVALMSDHLTRLPEAVALARATVRNLRQNVAIAVGTVSLLLAGVLAGGVTMAIGMFVHQASVLVVIANGMRLLRARPGTLDAESPATPPVPAPARPGPTEAVAAAPAGGGPPAR